MRQHPYLPLIVVLVLSLAACKAEPGTPVPSVRFINHPQPSFKVDFAPFADAGCPTDEYGFGYCQKGTPLAALSCDGIVKPPDPVGALRPSYPLAECLTNPNNAWASYRTNVERVSGGGYAYTSEGQYFYQIGGMESHLVRYVAYIDGRFTLIETEEEFRILFAPLESPEEALSYVQAVTGLRAYHGLKQEPNYVYSTREIEDTHVDSVSDGYVVHMYYYDRFGCGPHWTYTVDFHITREGNITQENMQSVFRDTTEDGLCRD